MIFFNETLPYLSRSVLSFLSSFRCQNVGLSAHFAMSRLLLAASCVGFVLVLWSFLISATVRPTPFDLLTNDLNTAAATHHFQPEEKEILLMRVSELQRAHVAEVRRCTRAFAVSFFGLLAFSTFCLVAGVLCRSRSKPFAPAGDGFDQG